MSHPGIELRVIIDGHTLFWANSDRMHHMAAFASPFYEGPDPAGAEAWYGADGWRDLIGQLRSEPGVRLQLLVRPVQLADDIDEDQADDVDEQQGRPADLSRDWVDPGGWLRGVRRALGGRR